VCVCNSVVDSFIRPKLARAVQCSVERIVIRLSAAIEKFEASLCTAVMEDYIRRTATQAQGQAQVLKRYLRVFVSLVLM
jgi:bacterioferritin-associated ferredoxin